MEPIYFVYCVYRENRGGIGGDYLDAIFVNQTEAVKHVNNQAYPDKYSIDVVPIGLQRVQRTDEEMAIHKRTVDGVNAALSQK